MGRLMDIMQKVFLMIMIHVEVKITVEQGIWLARIITLLVAVFFT